MNIYLIVLIIALIANLIGFSMYEIIKNNRELKLIFITLMICLSIVLIGVSFVKDTLEYLTLSGSVFGTFVLALALYFQVRTSRRQQVEAKFFELVKYYRDNITEMRFRNPFYYRDENGRDVDEEYVTGRRVIKTIFEQYKVARKVSHKVIGENINCLTGEEQIDAIEKNYLKNNFNELKNQDGQENVFNRDLWKQKYVLNEIAYQIMFWGIPQDIDEELESHVNRLYDNECNFLSIEPGDLKKKYKLNEIIKHMVAVWEYDIKGTSKNKYSAELKGKEINDLNIIILRNNYEGRVKFFGGHQYHLGHYFRHLYQAVKYIDSQLTWLFSDEDKKDYIKTLRAQMSNYEQALLFINSLTRLGRKWEYESDGKNLISKYNLIKNLPQNFIPYMKPQYFYPEVDYEWFDKDVEY